ncbi:hypothetical protein F8S13_25560 [Chloroflexia bacterium SDU3-3]|nr:hypothetical protein F8S13_25560 [Chloroflexia bacterium SDU3-3]
MFHWSTMGRGLALCALAGALSWVGAAVPAYADAPTPPVLGGSLSAFAVDMGWAYVGQGSSLVVLDGQSFPMQQAAALPLVGPASQLVHDGARLYVAEQVSGGASLEGRLEIFDIQSPQSPALLGSLALPAPISRLAVVGTSAYVLTGGEWSSEIRVVDVANPAAPADQGALDTGSQQILDLATDGQILYGFGADQLLAWDVQHPYAFGSVLDLPWADARQAALSGGRAYLLSGQGSAATLAAIDLQNPQQPALVASAAVPGAAALAVEGTLAYVGSTDGSVDVLDVGDLASAPFQLAGHIDVGLRSAGQIAVVNGQIVVLDPVRSTLSVLSFAQGQASVQDTYDTYGAISTLAVSGDLAYLGTTEGLRVVSLAPASYGRTLGSWEGAPGTALTIRQLVATGHQLVALVSNASGQAGLLLFDVQNPAIPQPLGSIVLPGDLSTLDVSGSLALVGVSGSPQSQVSGLYVVDIAQPSAPSILGTVAWASSAPLSDVAVDGAYAYALGAHVLSVVDLSSPAQPSLVGQAQLGNGYGEAKRLTIQQGLAAVALAGGYQFYDLSSPAQPTLVTTQSADQLVDVAFGDGTAVALSNAYGAPMLTIADLSLPSGALSPRHEQPLPFAGVSVALAGQQAYVLLADGSVRVFSLS